MFLPKTGLECLGLEGTRVQDQFAVHHHKDDHTLQAIKHRAHAVSHLAIRLEVTIEVTSCFEALAAMGRHGLMVFRQAECKTSKPHKAARTGPLSPMCFMDWRLIVSRLCWFSWAAWVAERLQCHELSKQHARHPATTNFVSKCAVTALRDSFKLRSHRGGTCSPLCHSPLAKLGLLENSVTRLASSLPKDRRDS